MHYLRLWKYGDVNAVSVKSYLKPVKERLLAGVVKSPTGCWEWKSACTGKDGKSHYGMMQVNNKPALVHRVSYELFVGPIPEDTPTRKTFVCHKCDNPKCVNPDHLFLGTPKENTQDMIIKGRKNHPVGERVKGAKLTRDKVLKIRSSTESPESLSKMYGVTTSTINSVKKGATWTHV